MRIGLRRTVFLLFFLSFIIGAPALIFYTAGYRFYFNAKQIVPTGAISIESLPVTASVWIDGKETTERTPALISHILAGPHTVELKKDNYIPWKKTVNVTSRQTTFITPALLVIDESTPTLVASFSTAISAYHAPSASYVYGVRQNPWIELWFTNLLTSETHLIGRYSETNEILSRLTFSTKGTYINADFFSSKGHHQIMIKKTTGEEQDLKDDRIKATNQLTWDAASDDVFSYMVNARLFLYNLSTTSYKETPYQVEAIQHNDQTLTALTAANDRIILSRYHGTIADIIGYLPLGEYEFIPSIPGYLVAKDIKRDRLFILEDTPNQTSLVFQATASLLAWSPDNTCLLYSDGFELHRFCVTTNEDETLTRVSDPIKAIAWHPSNQGAFFSQTHTISLIEFDEIGGRITTPIATAEHVTALAPSPDSRFLTFSGIIDGKEGIWQRRLRK